MEANFSTSTMPTPRSSTTTWQIENSEINKIAEIDDVVNKKKADDYIKLNEFITEREQQQKVQQLNYNVFCLWTLVNMVRLNNPFGQQTQSEQHEIQLNRYIGKGQVPQTHRPLHQKRSSTTCASTHTSTEVKFIKSIQTIDNNTGNKNATTTSIESKEFDDNIDRKNP